MTFQHERIIEARGTPCKLISLKFHWLTICCVLKTWVFCIHIPSTSWNLSELMNYAGSGWARITWWPSQSSPISAEMCTPCVPSLSCWYCQCFLADAFVCHVTQKINGNRKLKRHASQPKSLEHSLRPWTSVSSSLKWKQQDLLNGTKWSILLTTREE